MPNWRGFDIAAGFEMGFWPVVLYSAPPSIPDQDMAEVIDSLGLIRSLKIPFCMVLDLRKNQGITALQRSMITDAMTERDEESNDLVCGLGMVFASRLMSSLLTAIFWVRKPKYETKVFADPKAAIAWAQAQLAQDHEAWTASS